MKKREGFTLIELVSVLVILAILALIVTPLVLNIIKKARTAADKRSIDAYGRSIELAIADYLLENGTFPTSIDQLTIEYSGDRIVCSTTNLNSDSSVYLAECTVNNREITGYTYGTDKSPSYTAYSVGDEVTYNNVDYYVIKDSDAVESSVTLLKAEPLTVAEVNEYGAGHVNMYVTADTNASYYQTASDQNGYGGMAYYSSLFCRATENDAPLETDCKSDYDSSEIKYVVDSWSNANTNAKDLSIDSTGYSVRIIKIEELFNLGYEMGKLGTSDVESMIKTDHVPSWVYSDKYMYWTMSVYEDSLTDVNIVDSEGQIYHHHHVSTAANGPGVSYNYVVRPVIILKKSALN